MPPVATSDDVRALVDTDLSGTDIQPWLDLTAREIDRSYDVSDFEDAEHRTDFEAALTALRIISGLDRRPNRVSVESSTVSFDTSEVAFLRVLTSRLEPGNAITTSGGVTRDANRHVRSANNPRNDQRITRADRNPDQDLEDAIDDDTVVRRSR